MREIKFRAWDTESKEMSVNFGLFDFDRGYCIPFDRCIDDDYGNTPAIIMQYTGLKDKNGVEIYEGDIIKWLNEIGEVRYVECEFMIIGKMGYFYGYEGSEFSWDEIEVIGNIYENQELLETK